ncbi:uncharacterized protein LOC127095103 [Lathyrus oleraceus]|uniref:uncharacterized protein LOC127095103 n=1 Tax=Pisum sativum TaxID=3888 RepID=UPI0021D0D8F5|nr:uncharacterized protein LOC127095103 [Pisum sativum]
MFTTAEIKERLTKAFSSLQENVYKGKLTHFKEIQAFQKYFETVYNPMELVQTVCYATPILKEKFEKQIAKKKFPKAGSGKPPLTPKKRKVPIESVILVEDDEKETPPTPLMKKQKKNKATVAPYQKTKQQGDEIKILPPPSKETQSHPSGGAVMEHIGSNASDPEAQQEKPTTPLISTANQSDPSSDSKQAEGKDSEEKEDSEDTPSNSPPRVMFPSDYADEDDQDSDEIEGYFQQDEDMSEGEADLEGNPTGTGDAIVETVPNPTNVRSSAIQTSPISLTEEEKNALKQNDPLKYVRLMMAQRESSSENRISGASTHSELQKKISDAKAKQAAIQGLDSTEADNLVKQSVDHVEKATAINADIARLRGVKAVVQYKIGLAR